MSTLNSICVLRLSAIGDTCNAVAAVQAIQRQHPQASITWVIGKAEAALLQGLPGIEFVVFNKKDGLAAFRTLRRHMAGRRFDVLLQMQVALRANLASLCIPAKRRIGYDKARSKELHSLFINERIQPASRPHVLDTFLQFAAALGVPLAPPAWDIPVADEDQRWARDQLAPNTRGHLVIVPAASARERNWHPERYATVADHAAQNGFSVYLCGGPTELELTLASDIMGSCSCNHPPINLVGQSSLKQLFALLRAADLVLAPDTGPAHMAVAAGTPVIGLYAHSNPARTGPYSWQNYVVDAYSRLIEQHHGKPADQLPWGQRLKGHELMEHISKEQVCTMFDRVVTEQSL
ncbi:glycosyltransferase family 9 protein [Marinobacter mobilis]|uniref:glycosyltransferase family 9 protein n=1 Tax=Marinobacter mobilis TaxID=488533 RepID=UPI0035C6DA94